MAAVKVVIIGAGPAGIFTALRLVDQLEKSPERPNWKITIIDKGKAIDQRHCPSIERRVNCINCPSCGIISGWGGAGAFSDGKLTLSPDVGGQLDAYIGRRRLEELLAETDSIYLRFGAPDRIFGDTDGAVEEIAEKAIRAGLRLVPSRIRHLGTGYSQVVLRQLQEHLAERGVEIRMGVEVADILTSDARTGGLLAGDARTDDLQTGDAAESATSGATADRPAAGKQLTRRVVGVRTAKGEEIAADYVVAAPGREGAEWLGKEARRLGIPLAVNPVDIGVRVEVPSVVMEDITSRLWEAKFIYYSKMFEDRVRTFCMCPHGEVVTENLDGLITVNGHSYAELKTENTNFALLVSKTFTEPFKEPITFGKYIARLANLLGGGVLVQRLGDLLAGHRSTPERLRKSLVRPTLGDATPGDLSLVLPYRYLRGIVDMLEALDRVAPGVHSRDTLLYGVEVKFYSSRLELSKELETPVRNLFAMGDGAGVTRGLMQASASGLVVAEAILARAGRKNNAPGDEVRRVAWRR